LISTLPSTSIWGSSVHLKTLIITDNHAGKRLDICIARDEAVICDIRPEV